MISQIIEQIGAPCKPLARPGILLCPGIKAADVPIPLKRPGPGTDAEKETDKLLHEERRPSPSSSTHAPRIWKFWSGYIQGVVWSVWNCCGCLPAIHNTVPCVPHGSNRSPGAHQSIELCVQSSSISVYLAGDSPSPAGTASLRRDSGQFESDAAALGPHNLAEPKATRQHAEPGNKSAARRQSSEPWSGTT